MAGPYTEVMQDDDDERIYGSSPPTSLSPAFSSSPTPLLPSADATFTPVSMDSESYLNHNIENNITTGSRDTPKETLNFRTATATTADLAQSVTASARATAATANEYERLSPSPGAADPSPPSPKSDLGLGLGLGLVENQKANERQNSTHDFVSRDTSLTPAEKHNLQQPNIVCPRPILRTASTKSVTLVHPSPSVRSRSSSRVSNVAQLEATAEELSRTSSIASAIRELHEEQKRSDSRRSSILAASVGAVLDGKESFPFARQISGASSILDINNTARHGGYSPAGYIMSPNHSLLSSSNPSRVRSGSHTRSDIDVGEPLSRSGPGKSSTRSTKSATKPGLTDIAELEPCGLTLAAMDEADRLEEHPEDDETLQLPPLEDIDLTPGANHYHTEAGMDYWDRAVADAQDEHTQQQQLAERARARAGSTGTFEQAELAFADFDGAHCSPYADDTNTSPFDLDLTLGLSHKSGEEADHRPRFPRPNLPTVRPKSYLDPETGQEMLFYPARVPMMLNMPQKLSKRPQAAVRSKRRSQVLSAMPEANRQSAAWLPEVLPEPRFDPLGSGLQSDESLPLPLPEATAGDTPPIPPTESEAEPQVRPNPRPIDPEFRKSRMSIMDPVDKRKSRMSIMDPADRRKSRMSYNLDNLPPQLRASAFFDLPSETPEVALKDGSAMATLDSILDASAAAPISAFTDHAFAGKLGTEVYGAERKRKSHMPRASVADMSDVKKRSSIFHLRTPSKISIVSSKGDKRHTRSGSRLAGEIESVSDDERTGLSGSIDGQAVRELHEGEESEEDEEEEDESEQDSDEEDEAIHGPPTTLLAELQYRKRQQKLRTRAPAQAYPNGMHSTLLEIDTVAELERRNRQAKKVNLAWEDPNLAGSGSDDEDVPLGLLAAKKSGADFRTLQAEMNRPLGLMERRNMEDNEPLSRRRDRLHGRQAVMQKPSMMTLGSGGALGMSGGSGLPSPALQSHTPEEEEIEGETLAERMRRLRAREKGDETVLPAARPVSTAFSVEMLSQLGDTFKHEQQPAPAEKGKQKAVPVDDDEGETLGQRRRRLQAEREAREKEMLAGANPSGTVAPLLTPRRSMADVLGASRKTVLTDPRAEAQRARQEEAERFQRSQDQKMAALRAQMPTTLNSPNLQQPGGYMAGQFNDGTGGGLGRSKLDNNFGVPTSNMTQPIGSAMGMSGGLMNHGLAGHSVYNTTMAGGGYGLTALGQNGYGYNMPHMQMQLSMQQPGQQYDRVDRWRQSIVP